MLLVGPELQDLLVDGGRAREKPLFEEVVRDAREVLDSTFELARAHEQVAERVDGAPVPGLVLDDLLVLGDRLVEPALAKEFFGFS